MNLAPDHDAAMAALEARTMIDLRARLLPAMAIAALAIAACSTGTPSSAPAAPTAVPATGDVCAEADAVRASLADLQELDLIAVGKNGLTAAVADVKTAVTTLADAARESVGPEAQALRSALDNLQTTVDGLSDDAGVLEKATQVKDAVTEVQVAAAALKVALTQCQ